MDMSSNTFHRRLVAVCAVLVVTGCGGAESAPQRPPAPVAPASGTPSAALPGTAPPGTAAASGVVQIAFVPLGADGGGAGTGAAEVTDPAALDRFLSGPPAADRQVRDAVAGHRLPGVRLFAFRLSGCRNERATLTIEPARIHATLVESGVQCLVAEYFVAVFAVPAGRVPAGARIGETGRR